VTTPLIDFRHYTHEELPQIRQTLLDIHADAYADSMHDKFVQQFPWFVDHWGGNPDFSCMIAYDGGEPVTSDGEPGRASAYQPTPQESDLSIRVQQALREGPLIDSRVTEVTTPSGRVKATIVVRGEDGTPPEQLLAVLRSLKIDVTVEGLSGSVRAD
jgi:hypothetical protein